MSRLDSNGILTDYTVGQMERMAFDHGNPELAAAIARQHAGRGGRPRVTPRPGPPRQVARSTFTVTADTALRAAAELRDAANHARENSALGRLIPGYFRLK